MTLESNQVVLPLLRSRKWALLAALLVLLVFQAIGWLVAWDLARTDARRAAAQVLREPKGHTSWRTVSAAALRAAWVGKREFRLDGHLYDLRTILPRGRDSLLVELYHDAREETLVSALDALLHPAWQTAFSGQPRSQPLHLALLKWMSSPFLQPDGLAGLPDRRVWAQPLFSYHLPGSQLALSRQGPPPKMPNG